MIVLLGLYVGLMSLGLFHWYLVDDDPETLMLAQTVAFTGIIVIEKVNVLNFRALRQPISSVGWFSNPWILAAIAVTLLLQVAAVYIPALQPGLHTVALGWREWALIVAAALPVFAITEVVKIVASRRSRVAENP
ncbi:membrane protein containing ATPase, P-type cation-transporter [Rhodopirellula sallentina SM41]|uniref:Membrane protein containing ATPase, P-type cation-transporter n=2 Tax=Rhodopirellula TaxID=265488 RepID=M5UJ48_9BACT|nr:membrane protein containing ATPase, P-type cation-transporter [Rhodopirellula sallentina SM41]